MSIVICKLKSFAEHDYKSDMNKSICGYGITIIKIICIVAALVKKKLLEPGLISKDLANLKVAIARIGRG
jgi:hypothetical protein